MKKTFGLLRAWSFSALLLVSCSSGNDSKIRATIDQQKKEMKELAGITATVEKGVVTLSGECSDENAKSRCEQSVRGIEGVKQVIDNCTVATPTPVTSAPVVINADDSLSGTVKDAVKDYPGVHASVNEGVITLTGDIARSNLQKLMMNLHSLKPKKINNQLTIK